MFIGISSMFYTGLSLKCYLCSDYLNHTGLNACDYPKVSECENGVSWCGKSSHVVNGNKIVSKTCVDASQCQGRNYTKTENGKEVLYNCCHGDLCNGSETVFKNNFLQFSSFFLFSISKQLF